MRTEVMRSRRSLLAEAAAALAAAGVSQPRREALRLWSELVGASSAELLLEGQVAVDQEAAAALRHAVRRRAGGEPLAHVTGRAGLS